MEKFKVTFTAENQQLKSNGIKHASDTYADIEAAFILGAGWTDMDSVSAVWWNDFTKIATVLDSEGTCTVPHEVLTRKGCVRVNLVGSIVENGELVIRLTSYSAEAIQVNEKIKLTGSETTEITPSQYEQFAANVRADADRAEAAKDEARESATAASASAQRASESAAASSNSATRAAQASAAAEVFAQSASEASDEAEAARDAILGMRATATTLPEGSDATARYSDGLLTLGIPRGDRGEQGIRGETGATPNLTIGTVETLAPTEDATATITGTAEEPVLNLGLPKGDTGEVSLADLEELLPVDTASGEIASFPDGQSVIPAKSLKVALSPIQDLNGYDKPWAGGAGKNKLPMTVEGIKAVNTYHPWSGNSTTINNVAITIETSNSGDVTGIRFNGTASADITFNIATNINIPNGSYKWSNDQIVNVPNLWLSLTNPDVAITLSIGKEKNITINNGAIGSAYIYASAGNVFNNVLFKPMIRLASETDATFAPYSNICPISGRTEVDAVVSPTTDASDGNTYHTDLGRTVYGGVLDVVSGELVVDRAMVMFDGTEDWYSVTAGTNANRALCAVVPNAPSGAYNWNLYGSYIVGTGMAQSMPPLWQANFNPSGHFLVGIPTTITTVTEWKAYLAQNPLQLVYELATPQTYQLTAQQVALLMGTNNVWSDSGEVTVVYSADIQRWVEKKLATIASE